MEIKRCPRCNSRSTKLNSGYEIPLHRQCGKCGFSWESDDDARKERRRVMAEKYAMKIELMLPPDERFRVTGSSFEFATIKCADKRIWFNDDPVIFAAAASTMWNIQITRHQRREQNLFALQMSKKWERIPEGKLNPADATIVAYDKEKAK